MVTFIDEIRAHEVMSVFAQAVVKSIKLSFMYGPPSFNFVEFVMEVCDDNAVAIWSDLHQDAAQCFIGGVCL